MTENTDRSFWPFWADLLIIFTIALICASLALTILITAYGSYRNGTANAYVPGYRAKVSAQ